MRGVVGNLWGIVSIAHSVKSDDVEDVGGKGMYVERGEGRSVWEAGGGFIDPCRCRGEPKYIAAALFHPQTSREDLPPGGGLRSMSQNGRVNKIT